MNDKKESAIKPHYKLSSINWGIKLTKEWIDNCLEKNAFDGIFRQKQTLVIPVNSRRQKDQIRAQQRLHHRKWNSGCFINNQQLNLWKLFMLIWQYILNEENKWRWKISPELHLIVTSRQQKVPLTVLVQNDQRTYLNCLSVVLVNIDPYSSFLELGIHTFHHIKIYMFLLSVEKVALL